MCFHGNQHPWAIKHPFISLYSKYQSFKYIYLPAMSSPIFPILADIYCILLLKSVDPNCNPGFNTFGPQLNRPSIPEFNT